MHTTARHALSTLGAALLLACSSEPTMPPGPLGEVDLATRLPAGVTVPAETKSHEAAHAVCPNLAGDPAHVRVRWKTFSKDGAAYVSSYSVALEKSSPGLTVQLGGAPSLQNANAATGGPHLAAVGIALKCARNSSKLTVEGPDTIYIRADGVSSTRPR